MSFSSKLIKSEEGSCKLLIYSQSFRKTSNNTRALDGHLKWNEEGQFCRTEPSTCGVWCCLWVVSELSWIVGYAASVQSSACYWCGEPPIIHTQTVSFWVQEPKRITNFSPGWCSSVDWVWACEPKGHWFDSQSGHMPRLWARSPSRRSARGNHTLMFLSLSPSLLLSLKINK